MHKVCILFVLITYVYQNARFKKREINSNNLGYLNFDDEMELLNPWFSVLR